MPPAVVACASCGKKLRVAEGAARLRCPGCGEIVSAAETAITPTPAPAKSPRKQRPPADADEGISASPAEDMPRVARKKKARPRKKPKEEKKGGIPLWVIGGVVGVILLFGALVSAAVIHAGYGLQLLGFAIAMAILLPVSVVILVGSMFLSSALLGGIDFGEAHVAVPKAAALLFVVSLIQMIPFVGPFLALPVWILGLMGLFDLDFVEARTLAFVNWCLNFVFRLFILSAVVSAFLHGHDEKGLRDRLPYDEANTVMVIEALGGECHAEKDGGSVNVTEVSLEGRPVGDKLLASLRSFPKLRSLDLARTNLGDAALRQVAELSSLEELDLSGNPVGDAGIDQLTRLRNLKVLHLAETQVSEQGVRRLRAALPGLEVVR